MTHDIFLSYSHENTELAVRLAGALEKAGLTVWWDRSLVTGENWRNQIQAALDGARTVVVIWSPASAGPEGDFVRDEAQQGKTRGVLVPVMMRKTRVPLGFGEVQYHDLIGWRGSARNAFFQDLVATIRAKIDGAEAPKPKGPAQRLRRRLSTAVALPVCGGLAAFGANILSIQESVCSVGFVQPGLSDSCGAWKLGGKPTKQERLAWTVLPSGDCEALGAHIRAFPDGAYRGRAADLIAGAEVKTEEIWRPATRPQTLYVPAGEATVSPSLEAAQADAQSEDRAGFEAERVCRGFENTKTYRLQSVRFEVERWQCRTLGSGHVCAFDGKAICEVEERWIEETRICGGPA